MNTAATKSLDHSSLGTWLFIASEGMFFVALMGAFVVLSSQQHNVFAVSSHRLSVGLGITASAALVLSTALLARLPWASLGCAILFLITQAVQIKLLGQALFANNFFGFYLLLTSAHALHLVGGVIALLWFLLLRPGGVPAALASYWHFVNVVGLFSLACVYFT